jgi:polyisoprenoid-binding protein YceI
MTTSTLSRIGIPTGTWKVDRDHTRVGFAVKHLGVATVRGEFREFEGALEVGEDLADTRGYGRVESRLRRHRAGPARRAPALDGLLSPPRAILS